MIPTSMSIFCTLYVWSCLLIRVIGERANNAAATFILLAAPLWKQPCNIIIITNTIVLLVINIIIKSIIFSIFAIIIACQLKSVPPLLVRFHIFSPVYSHHDKIPRWWECVSNECGMILFRYGNWCNVCLNISILHCIEFNNH